MNNAEAASISRSHAFAAPDRNSCHSRASLYVTILSRIVVDLSCRSAVGSLVYRILTSRFGSAQKKQLWTCTFWVQILVIPQSSSLFFVCSTLLQAVRPWTPLAGGESLAFCVRSCDFDCYSACFANNIPRSLRYTVVACMVHRRVDLLSTTPALISTRRNTLVAGRFLTWMKTS